MKTLSEVINVIQKDGFKENFIVKDHLLFAPDANKYYAPVEVRIANFYRFEGTSDPGDSSILYAIETTDGVKGILTDAYGAYSEETTTNFIKEVEEIGKKTEHKINRA
ncbi:MAG: hypothetical protein M3R17_09715 [Bacteroidota bacterium]|nr:hypothetical protein [Bacteroidota bacterium]